MTNEQEQLVLDNINLANNIAWKYSKILYKQMEFEEIQAIAYLGLVKSAKTFDKDKNFTFSTYSYTVMKNEILTALKELNKSPNIFIISLDSEIDNNLSFYDVIDDNYNVQNQIENKLLKEDFYRNINKLSEIEKSIITYYINGYTMQQIGNMYNYSQPQISIIIQKIVNKLRDKLLDKGE